VLCLYGLSTLAQAEEQKDQLIKSENVVKILCAGKSAFKNRYGNMMSHLKAFADADDLHYEADNSIAYDIRNRWNLATLASEPALQNALVKGDYDYIIIHHRNNFWNSDNNEPAYKGSEALHELIIKSGGQTVLWMTYEWGPASTDIIAEHRLYWETAKRRMDEHLIDGKIYPALMTPTMILVAEMKDKWGDEEVLPDSVHLNHRSLFAISALIYTYISGNDPRISSYTPEGISSEDIEWIKNKAWEYYKTYYTPKKYLKE
jgi:hypothetical protein